MQTDRWADRQTVTTKLIFAFVNLVNVSYNINRLDDVTKFNSVYKQS
jgi:hypothetical protein